MIELIGRKQRDEKRQVAFVKIDGQEFSVGNVPADLDDAKCLIHLQAREDEIKLVILRKQYPEADVSPFRKDGKSELQIFQDWVLAGCLNKVQTGQDEEGKAVFKDVKIDPQPIGYRIPKEITALAALDSAKTIVELKNAIYDLLKNGGYI